MSDFKNIIMVIEDESLLLRAITKKLQKSGFETVSCIAAKQALNYLATLEQLPDLIWLDYYLGDMDGIAFMEELAKMPKAKDIPVICISNSASQKKVDRMLALGVKKYLLKAQHRLDDLVQVVEEYATKVGDGA